MIWFLMFLCLGVWQDLRCRRIRIGYLVAFGLAGLVFAFRAGRTPAELLWSVTPGAALLLAGKAADGAIGEGDGWFLTVSGFFLGPGENWIFLLSGVTFCGMAGLFWMVWGQFRKKAMGRKRLPFLPFLLPAGLWLALA